MSRATIANGAALVLGVAAICAVLVALGPWLDRQQDAAIDPQQDDEDRARRIFTDRLEREARALCARRGGNENSAYIRTPWGRIDCTDKHGRKLAQKGGQ